MQCTTQHLLSVSPPDCPLLLEYQEQASLSASFLPYINNKELSDVTFMVGNHSIKFFGHKTILAMRSEYFKKMFNSSLKESLPNCTISKPNVQPKIFLKVLEYLYTGKLQIHNEREAVKLMITAEEFQMDNIVEAAVHYLRHHLTIHNACTMLELARQHYIASLEEICMTYLATHARKIFCPPENDTEDGLMSLSEETLIQLLKSDALAIEEIEVFRGVVSWSKKKLDQNSGRTLPHLLESIIPNIRFAVMTPAELLEVEQTNLVPEKVLYNAFKHLLLPQCTTPSTLTSFRRGKLQFEESLLLSPEHQHTLASWYTHNPNKEWMLCYRGSRDGFNSRVFHAECDERGETFTVLLVEPFQKQDSGQYLLGGYTSNSWSSWGRPQQDPHAFLFSFGTWKGRFHQLAKRGANAEPPTQWKMPIVPNFAHCATMGSSSYGPVFGGGRDIMVDLNHRECSFRPHSFGCPPPGAFPMPTHGSHPSTTGCANCSCALVDIEVFCKPRPRRASIS